VITSRSRGRYVLASTLAGVALVASACGSDAGSPASGGGSSGDTFKVGFVTPATGAQATDFQASKQGVEAAVAMVNQKNLARRKLEVVTADDANDPRTAGQACNRLVNQEHVQAIVGFESTPNRSACNAVLAAKHIPYVAGQPSAGDYCPSNMFLDGLIPNQLFIPLVDTLSSKGSKKVYFIGNNFSSAKATEKFLSKALPAKGISLVGSSYESFGTTDWSSDLSKVIASKADTLIITNVGGDEVSLWKQVASDPRTAKLTRVDPLLTSGVAKATGPAIDGVMTVNSYYDNLDFPGNSAYKSAVSSKFGGKAQTDSQGAHLWDAVLALGTAIGKADSTDGTKIIQALSSTSIDGARGKIAFTPTGKGFVTATAYVGESTADGGATIIKTYKDLAPQPSC
jgi:ABC-type branched-subunit amino acid transport system substrate-binding protein